MQRLNIAHVRSLAIPFPPLEEQKAIVAAIQDRLKLSLNVLSVIGDYKENLEGLANSILSRAFRGELVPQDPNDEPALILLERIRQEKSQKESEQKSRGKRKKRL